MGGLNRRVEPGSMESAHVVVHRSLSCDAGHDARWDPRDRLCYSMIVSVRHITLAVSGAVVLALSLYLYVKVRAAPAEPSPTVIEGAKLKAEIAQPPLAGPTDPWAPGLGSPQARAEATRNQLVGPADTRVEPQPTPPTPT